MAAPFGSLMPIDPETLMKAAEIAKQTWPVRAVESAIEAVKLPGKAWRGEVPGVSINAPADWRDYSDTPPQGVPGTEKVEPGLADAVGFGSILPRSQVATNPTVDTASDLAGLMAGGSFGIGPGKAAGEAIVGSGPQRIMFNDPIHKEIAMRNAERSGGGTQTMYPSQAALDRSRGVVAPEKGSWDDLVSQTMARWGVDKAEARQSMNDARVIAQSRTGETMDDIARDFTLGSGGTDKKGSAIAGGEAAAKSFDFSNPGGGTREVRIGNTDITYGVGKDGVEVTLVRTPKEHRGAGSARTAMQKMIEEADEAGVRLELNADPMDKGVSKGGLVDFYKSLGFKRNAGNKRDFSTRAEYIRDPKL